MNRFVVTKYHAPRRNESNNLERNLCYVKSKDQPKNIFTAFQIIASSSNRFSGKVICNSKFYVKMLKAYDGRLFGRALKKL